MEFKGQATQEQIDNWKQAVKEKYGETSKVFFYSTEDGRICYFRSVDRSTYSVAASKIASAGIAKFNETLVDMTWLGGDESIKKQNGSYFGLIDHIEEMMAKVKGTLGEL